jgi:hypothetical protein
MKKEAAGMRSVLLGVLGAAAVLLGGCAAAPVGDTDYQVSGLCGFTVAGQPDTSFEGASTRSGAVSNLLDWYRTAAKTAVRGDAPSTELAMLPPEDPLQIQIAIRGLEAALENVEASEREVEAHENVKVSGYGTDGRLLADVLIVHFDGFQGYYITDFAVLGYEDDDPRCVAPKN